jgi:GNAT superfamily N-acetyltransferase
VTPPETPDDPGRAWTALADGYERARATLPTSDGAVLLRRAVVDDVPAIVGLLTDDELGAQRDGVGAAEELEPYLRAFEAVDADDAHLLLVAESGDRAVATLQLSFIPGLARRGALRAQIEAVRVHSDLRGSGLGRAMVAWAIDEAGRRGCALVQLTSDKQRHEAHRFYSGLGFTASHEGFKLALESRESLRP